MRTWIIGDSIVKRAGGSNAHLNGGGQTIWSGFSGAKCTGLVHRISKMMYRSRYPTTIILHVGTNDIFYDKRGDLVKRVEENLVGLRQLLPQTRIIWSDIIVRLAYSQEKKKGAGKDTARAMNKRAHKVCRKKIGNAHVIVHSDILSPALRNIDSPVYQYDGTHPSDYGLLHFRQKLANALLYFNANPTAFCYPPGSADAHE